MKSVFSLLVTGALLLAPMTFAAPVDTAIPEVSTDAAPTVDSAPTTDAATTSDTTGGNTPNAQATVHTTPVCKSAAIYDLCMASNVKAYCDDWGFHNSIMATCKGLCWCE